MATSTGVLPFIRGADLSYNNFQAENFPSSIRQMDGLTWLKLNRTKLTWIPEEFSELDKLERLNLSHNELASLHGELIRLTNLKVLNCRHNKIDATNIPVELFNIRTLTVLDLSHNDLKVIPKNIESCISLKVLNLSHNKLTDISEQMLTQLSGLTHLDLSDNLLKTIPPQFGRLTNLRTLTLNNNPLEESKLRQIERLKLLQVLQLANTQRTVNSTPPNSGNLTYLVELDLSSNQLTKVPDNLESLTELRRLNLSDNLIEKMPRTFGDWWPHLEKLNLSCNNLVELPASLCNMCNLKRLYLNDNKLTFEGLPAALGKLHQLEFFMAARNKLESIPESIFRCGRLKKLILTSNRLITLPDTIHLLYDLEVLELSDNPELIIPPKPVTESSRNSEFYNIDFSLNTQLRLAGDPNLAKLSPQQPSAIKDPIARKLRLRRRARDDVEQESKQAKVLKGMKDLALEKDNLIKNQSAFLDEEVKPKRWDENLEKPPIDYSEHFDETTGQLQGLTMWEIDKFYPVLVNPSLHGKFYNGDCYVILSTHIDENLSLNWKIFFWIGSEASRDKMACSAFYAGGLKRHLHALTEISREEQGEESDEFLSLFPDGIDYVKGARASSGFYTVEEVEYPHRMFRLHEVADKARELHLQTVNLSSNSLDSRFVFLIDTGHVIFVWNGIKSKNTTKQKARLLGEKLNKEERKNKADLVFCDQGDESPELLAELSLPNSLPKVPFKTVDLPDDFEIETYQPVRPVLYQISLGIGYIELPQVEFRDGRPSIKSLTPTNVLILDFHNYVFVWLGRKSSKLARNAALKLAQELFSMITRPPFATITSCLQGTESLLFKTKFRDWDDVIAVDYTRTVDSVSKTGANLTKWMNEQKVKIDLTALFAPRQTPLTEEECQMLMEDWNDELELIETFILDKGKKFSKLPEEEFGHFYTEDCYVFLCRYYVPPDDLTSSDDESAPNANDELADTTKPQTNGFLQPNHKSEEDNFKCVVYFWQGRHASKMGWLTFTFSLQKKFEARFGNKLEVVQMHQQQENMKFLSHFKQKFIIHQGKRRPRALNKPKAFYQLRANGSPLTMRCIEINPDASHLNSGFCYILRQSIGCHSNGTSTDDESTSFAGESSAVVYIWVGSRAQQWESTLAREMADERLNIGFLSQEVSVIQEGCEPAEFWSLLGGKKDYDTDSSFMLHTRLFKCSNDRGYFTISEKCTDFCQDDLSDDDIMILDNGTQVFLWVGPKSSEVEIKLAYKSAQVYVQNLRLKNPNSRQLMITFKGKESRRFTKCFHAWGEHKIVRDPRGDEAKFLRANYQNDLKLTRSSLSFD